jgi:hypothetical protein
VPRAFAGAGGHGKLPKSGPFAGLLLEIAFMVEIMLPKASRVKKGRVWPAPAAANGKKPKRSKEFKVYRYNPD